MTDYIDLEDKITSTWSIISDLETVRNNLDTLSRYEVRTIISGLIDLYELRFSDVFSSYEDLIPLLTRSDKDPVEITKSTTDKDWVTVKMDNQLITPTGGNIGVETKTTLTDPNSWYNRPVRPGED